VQQFHVDKKTIITQRAEKTQKINRILQMQSDAGNGHQRFLIFSM
jgi:hypothetical protein